MSTTTLPPEAVAILPKLMNQRELANYLGKSTAWCERARWAGEGPRFIKLGRHVRYRADDVLEWLEENARTSTTGGDG
ncbi:helix-turn-helix domain-containing protein [Billgrantia sulfidoxydans]|uniref:Helix-turn-helix domain-containing protein n=1 Tax=Billgrantia sulfidoxydans TaxID=2733484 RepID=A0ABX7W517_9GAMM|nr:helix-turn-helix domain-containing protein [Halomonas sulfidoxydans]QTP55429.1 helix-turn-helix domain-containing protein [Halomonas sulfidoxydans]